MLDLSSETLLRGSGVSASLELSCGEIQLAFGIAALAEELNELRIREKEQGIEPDWVRNLSDPIMLSSCLATTFDFTSSVNSRASSSIGCVIFSVPYFLLLSLLSHCNQPLNRSGAQYIQTLYAILFCHDIATALNLETPTNLSF